MRPPLLIRLFLFINDVIRRLQVVCQDPTHSCSGTIRYCFVLPFHVSTSYCVFLVTCHVGDVPCLRALALEPRVIYVVSKSKIVHQIVMLLDLVTKRLLIVVLSWVLSWVLDLLAVVCRPRWGWIRNFAATVGRLDCNAGLSFLFFSLILLPKGC